jgi:hypothetical protein
VDATGLAKIVRLVGVESATAQADDGEGNDEVATAAYSAEEGSSGDRPTLSEGGTPRDEALVSPASDEPPTEETPVVKIGEQSAVVPTDAPDAVIISRIVVIGPPPRETGD